MPSLKTTEVKKKPVRKIPEQAERGGMQESLAVRDFKKVQAQQEKKSMKKKLPEVMTTKREVIYDNPGVTLYKEGGKHGPITADKAKEMLGWLEYDGPEYCREIKSLLGEKVILSNNVNNRPIYGSTIQLLKQEHLRKRWKLNGEPIIIGKTGLILNGQHTLISLICAAADYQENPEEYPEWSEEPVMEKVVVTGIDEQDEVVNTLDTCKPRSLTDVIFRSPYFDELKGSDRRRCAHYTDHAINLLWFRTGVSEAFELRKTHSESIDFLDKHPQILKCVKFLYEEDGEGEDSGKISSVIAVGYAAALMYLMGCSQSKSKAYYDLDIRCEDDLDWENWEKACDFWVDYASHSVKVSGIKNCLAELEAVRGSLTRAEKLALFVKAWRQYSSKGSVKNLTLEFKEDEEGISTLVECPVTGGIDLGVPDNMKDALETTETKEEIDEVPEKPMKSTPRKPKDKKAPIDLGDEVWVKDEAGGHWKGTVEGISEGSQGKTATIKVGKGYAGVGKVFEVHYDSLQREQPKEKAGD